MAGPTNTGAGDFNLLNSRYNFKQIRGDGSAAKASIPE
jgi:hypothetical protein